jgi:threonine 3-dehydrogenase
MTAIVKREPGPGIRLERMPIPQPGPDEVLVRVQATAICGTDLHIAEWNAWAQGAGIRLPFVLGHEFAGEVVEAGAGVRTHPAGTYVAGETHIPCGTCYQCRNGLQHICGRLTLFGVHRDGCFAEYATLPAVCAYPIPRDIPPRVAALLEPVGTSLRAVTEVEVAGGIVVVVGCGPIGLFAVAAARALGAARIIGVDVRAERRALARRLGCDSVLDPTAADPIQAILACTDGVGADALIESSGSVPAIEGAFRYLRKGGRCALIGLPSAPVRLNLGPDVVFKEARIIGIHGRAMFATWTQMTNLLRRGLLDVAPVITHEMPLTDCEAGFALLRDGQAGKIVLTP